MFRSSALVPPVILCLCCTIGCGGGPASIAVPSVDPDSVAKQAISQCDSDGDGHVSRDEAAAMPSMLHAFKKYDGDGDDQVSQEELVARFEKIFGGEIGMFTVGATVRLNGRPLAEAEVKLLPEPCFGETLKPASGTTRVSGRAMLSIAPGDLPANLQGVRGVNTGLYRIEITHPTIALPPKYNVETTLGREVTQDDQLRGLQFDLEGR